ncbi:MAG: phosphodiester glycosidase family protein [Deltaproteobacteria bacterium]|nr:phosphodiester glycosidase family protein [Deltaproteobacteria bacterium]
MMRWAAAALAGMGVLFAMLIVSPLSAPSAVAQDVPALIYKKLTTPSGDVHFVSMDPAKFRFEAVYTNPPQSVQARHADSKAILTVNGGYWAEDYTPTDLLVTDGKIVKSENKLTRFKGLFFVKGGMAGLRDLARKPLKDGEAEAFEQAVKCGPAIVRDGRPVAYKSTKRHRRTIIGEDVAGRIFFLVSDSAWLTYGDAAKIATAAPVNASFAFNLDGGSSTGLVIDWRDVHAREISVPVGSHIEVFEK